MIALTSLSPDSAATARQAACLASWQASGLEPVAFNAPAEISRLSSSHAVQYAPVEPTVADFFGRPFVPISTFLAWIATRDQAALILNADLQIRATPAQMSALFALADKGLPYLLQINHDVEDARPVAEACGVSGVIVHPRFCHLFVESRLRLGAPWWDYWVPYVYVHAGLPLYTHILPLGRHLRHGCGWSLAVWQQCAAEFGRITGLLTEAATQAEYSRMSATVFANIVARTIRVSA